MTTEQNVQIKVFLWLAFLSKMYSLREGGKVKIRNVVLVQKLTLAPEFICS